MAPFRKLYKKTCNLVSSLLNSLLYFRQALGITNLHQQHITNHITTLSDALDTRNNFQHILQHRMFQLAKDIHITCSPLLLNNFAAFEKTKNMNTDLILRILFYSSKIGISLTRPLRASQNVNNIPIHTIFNENPTIFGKSLNMIK